MPTAFQQVYDFLARGGPVLVLLAVASMVCLALVLERLLTLRKSRILPDKFVREMETLTSEKKITEALAFCRASDYPLARILSAGLSMLDEPKDEMKEAMEDAGRRETSFMERNLDFLGTLATAGPLVGLLGTVTGMIRTFGVVGSAGVGDPMRLAGGIAEALLNTAAGLVVGIPALIFQQYFFHRIDRYLLDMEMLSDRFMKAIKRG